MITDPALFASLPGGPAVAEWFGFTPAFHDATIERVEIADSAVSMEIAAFRMTDRVDAKGFHISDRPARVSIRIAPATDMSLTGAAGSIIFELEIRRLDDGDFEVAFSSSYGLNGWIRGRDVSLSLTPQG